MVCSAFLFGLYVLSAKSLRPGHRCGFLSIGMYDLTAADFFLPSFLRGAFEPVATPYLKPTFAKLAGSSIQ
jgi:hypothetical protein